MYKKAVTRYYQLQDYFLKTSSSQEGHFPDLILTKKDHPEFWVEAKSGKVSIFEKKFKKELLHYFIDWLALSDEKRFNFGVFVADLAKKEETKTIISITASIESTLAWLRDNEELELNQEYKDILETVNEQEIKTFFHNIEVNICPGFELDQITQERMNELNKFPNTHATKLLRETISRRKPSSKPSELVTNFMQLTFPTQFWEATSKYKLKTYIYKDFEEGIRLPAFVIPRYNEGDPVIRSFDSNLLILEPYMKTPKRQRDFLNLPEDRRLQLLNEHLRRWLWCKGLRRIGNDYYFPIEEANQNQQGELTPITVQGTKGLKVVTKPMYKDGALNFVQHYAVNIWLSKLGNDYGIYIWPKFLFTSDGVNIIEGDWASRIHRKYLRAEYNYNPNKRSQIKFWEHFLLNGPFIREVDNWFDDFYLHSLLKQPVNWSSETLEKGRVSLDVFLEE